MTAGRLSTVAGTGVCGTTGQGGPMRRRSCGTRSPSRSTAPATYWWPTAATSRCCWPPARGGTYYGTAVGAGDIGVVVGGHGELRAVSRRRALRHRPDRPSSTTPAGLAVGPTGALFVTDGFMHVIRVVPATAGTLLGRAMAAGRLYTWLAGALPVGPGRARDGTPWVLTQMGTRVGPRRGAAGAVSYADAGFDTVRA